MAGCHCCESEVSPGRAVRHPSAFLSEFGSVGTPVPIPALKRSHLLRSAPTATKFDPHVRSYPMARCWSKARGDIFLHDFLQQGAVGSANVRVLMGYLVWRGNRVQSKNKIEGRYVVRRMSSSLSIALLPFPTLRQPFMHYQLPNSLGPGPTAHQPVH